MVFHWNLSDSKSLQISRTHLRTLAVPSNALIWIVSTRPPISKSFRPFNNPLVIVPKAPTTIGPIAIFMFHSFFNSLARSWYLSFFSHSFSIIIIIIIAKGIHNLSFSLPAHKYYTTLKKRYRDDLNFNHHHHHSTKFSPKQIFHIQIKINL